MVAPKNEVVLTFVGTRGEFDARSSEHRCHSELFVEHKNSWIMIDCGADWLGRLRTIAPTAIVLTLAHTDHAGGLAKAAPRPVYATRQTLHLLCGFPIHVRRKIWPAESMAIGEIEFTAYRVQHSTKAPAVLVV